MVFGADDYDDLHQPRQRGQGRDRAGRSSRPARRPGSRRSSTKSTSAGARTSPRRSIRRLGAARTVLVVISSNSVSKDWPLAEINTALAFEVEGKKRVVALDRRQAGSVETAADPGQELYGLDRRSAPVVAALKQAARPEPPAQVAESKPVTAQSAHRHSGDERATPWGAVTPGPVALAPAKLKRRGFFAWLLGRE